MPFLKDLSLPSLPSGEANVGQKERAVSGAVGAMLVIVGLKRKSLFGLLVAAAGGELVRRAATGRSATYGLLGVNTSDRETSAGAPTGAKTISEIIVVDRPVEEVYRRWRDPATFAQAMSHFAIVSTDDPNRAHWTIKTPVGEWLRWEARLVDERPNELLRWESLPGSEVPNESIVLFREAPGGGGTEIDYRLSMGAASGRASEKALSVALLVPGRLVKEGMRRFKKMLETGETPSLGMAESNGATGASTTESDLRGRLL